MVGVDVVVGLAVGVSLGCVSGLTPGVHANAFALLLAGVAPSVPGSPLAVGVAVLGAGVTHSFVDVVPAISLGVPDAAMAATALPGHRLVLEGRGREALRVSALGSLGACALALVAAWPVTTAMRVLVPVLNEHLAVVLVVATLALAATERSWWHRGAAVVVAAVAGGFGVLALDVDVSGPLGESVLAAIFGGLFGAPVLLDALDGDGVPPQGDAAVRGSPVALAGAALAGTAGGGAVGYLPGVSSGVAAVLALAVVPGDAGDRGYLATVSGVNTANAIFAVFALVAFDSPRTGVLVAFDEIGAPLVLPVLVAAVVVAGVVGALVVVTVGDRYLAVVGDADQRTVVALALTALALAAWTFAGVVGCCLFAIATVIGLAPVRLGVKRVHLMSVLTLPIALTG
ncbi:tripartite tricarboxylate transporter permease [Halorubellus sp. PRR65]|uniref:tripartite tricarboxylate transporter permease n=1 Tax=Halorubellus sp. PRR65 TaxID=3098148 RepID=UPI002B25D93C|nr:tripartite tricarboxylate transporter permease [Halorubellus sp. PRR65]